VLELVVVCTSYGTLGGLSPPCSNRPPLSRSGAPSTAGLHPPYGQLVSSDVPPFPDKVCRTEYLCAYYLPTYLYYPYWGLGR
jgi:hypothetical protein